MKIKLGTRASQLALTQANFVKNLIEKKFAINTEIVKITTTGDKISQNKTTQSFDKATFIKELEVALIEKKIDIAVHSLKDVPSELEKKFKIITILKNLYKNDIIISKKKIISLNDKNLKTMGTNSPRRKHLVQAINPKIKIIPLRGNVPTRIEKLLNNKKLDAIILAKAGLARLKLLNEKNIFYHDLSPIEFHPCSGQGAICIEILKKNKKLNFLKKLSHKKTKLIAQTERLLLKKINADCHTPIGIFTQIKNKKIHISTQYFAANKKINVKQKDKITKNKILAKSIAKSILKNEKK